MCRAPLQRNKSKPINYRNISINVYLAGPSRTNRKFLSFSEGYDLYFAGNVIESSVAADFNSLESQYIITVTGTLRATRVVFIDGASVSPFGTDVSPVEHTLNP